MEKRKAQSEIITTVLIILLVLAAIIIVWQVVQRTIKGGTGQIEPAAACININLEVANSAVSTTNGSQSKVTVTRKAGGTDTTVSDIKFVIDGIVTETVGGAITLPVLETKDYTLIKLLSKGQKVEVAAVLSGGTVCNTAAEYIVP